MTSLGTAASILTIIGSIKATYSIIKVIRNLPKAFAEVQNKLPLIVSIVQGAEKSLEDRKPLGEEEDNVACEVLQPSLDKLATLKKIFRAVEDELEKDQNKKDWAKLRTTYHTALNGIKAHGVEKLMEEILKDAKNVALSHVFNLATTGDIKTLNTAIQDLSNVELSLPDTEFGSREKINATQHISDMAKGQQKNTVGGKHAHNVGDQVISGDGQTVYCGKGSKNT